MFNFFEELFAPGRKHASDERKRLELSRVDLNAGDPGRGPIDLTSGKVTVRAPDADRVDRPARSGSHDAALDRDASRDRPRPAHESDPRGHAEDG
ncbi:DUF6191 domain-containing protein [Streptomyces sp. NPDC088729]|uniref:DUF6191 domain-containing protein n=1 Tax=Streptomyces sp. NPDC088729 TaxID=3365876 RepID=UPI003808EA2B